MSHVFDRLAACCAARRSAVCVGLDPHLDQVPHVADGADPVQACRDFLFPLVEAIADQVPAVKPQIAFFEQLGPPGIELYFDLIRHAHRHDLFVVGDIKRADIGSTAAAYARAHLGPDDGSAADAVTLNPYLGLDSIAPFLELGRQHGRGVFVLVRTSNPSSRDFQELAVDREPLYRHVGRRLEEWGRPALGEHGFTDVGAVVGATAPEEAAMLRQELAATWFLVPGYGAQGGTAADVARTFNTRREGALISSSRGILFAYRRPGAPADPAEAARAAAQEMNAELNQALTDQLGAETA